MATAVQASQTPFQGVDYLSRNAQSSQLHTPLYLDRITTNQDSYNHFLRDQAVRLVKPKWGSNRLHRGLLESTQTKNQKVEQSHLDKSHMHFGGGELSYARILPLKALYNITSLKKSDVRPTDELVPNSNEIDVRIAQIDLPFHAERPYSSHTVRKAVFPEQKSPSDIGYSARENLVVAEKIRGSPYRREVLEIDNDPLKKPLQWHGNNFSQLVKNSELSSQQFYPSPANHTFWSQPPSLSVSQKTANVLHNIQSVYGKSEYSQRYTGHGLGESLKLDNCDKVAKRQDEFITRYENQFCSERTVKELNQGKVHNNEGTMLNPEEEQPYMTTYNADYSTLPSSPSILRNKPTKKNNLGRDNTTVDKTVKFNDKVTISDGHKTTSGNVNDLKENADPRQIAQRPDTPFNLSRKSSVNNLMRPATAPVYPGGSLARLPQNTASFHTGQTSPTSYGTLLRPCTAGNGRILRDQLFRLQNNYSKSAANRQFHIEYPENAPDIRRKPDTRITTNERRHVIPEVGCHSYYFHG